MFLQNRHYGCVRLLNLSRLIFLLGCVFSILQFTGCVKLQGGTEEDTSSPIVIAGGGKYLVTPENGRNRCAFEEVGDLDYRLTCSAVVFDPEAGSEYPATSAAPGVVLSWDKLPLRIGGAEIVRSNFIGQTSDLTVQYDIVLSQSIGTDIEIALDIVREKTGTSVRVKEKVTLPLSVLTFGAVPAQPLQFNVVSRPGETDKVDATYSTQLWDSTKVLFNNVQSACSSNTAVYFFAEQQVYKLSDGKVSLFAGAAKPQNLQAQDKASRYSVYFGTSGIVACTSKTLYVASSDFRQIFAFDIKTGALSLVIGDPNTSISQSSSLTPDTQPPIFSSMVASPDGHLYFGDKNSQNNVIWHLSPDRKLKKIPSVNSKALALSSSGDLYAIQVMPAEFNTDIAKINVDEGTFIPVSLGSELGTSVHLEIENNILFVARKTPSRIVAVDIASGALASEPISRQPSCVFRYQEKTHVCVNTSGFSPTGLPLPDTGQIIRLNPNAPSEEIIKKGFNIVTDPTSLQSRIEHDPPYADFSLARDARFGNITGLAFKSDGNLITLDHYFGQIGLIDSARKISRISEASGIDGATISHSGTIYLIGMRSGLRGVWRLSDTGIEPVLVSRAGADADVPFVQRFTAIKIFENAEGEQALYLAADEGPSNQPGNIIRSIYRMDLESAPTQGLATPTSPTLIKLAQSIYSNSAIRGLEVASDGTVFFTQDTNKILRLSPSDGVPVQIYPPSTIEGEPIYTLGPIALDGPAHLYAVETTKRSVLRFQLNGSSPSVAAIPQAPEVVFGGSQASDSILKQNTCGGGVIEVSGDDIESKYHSTLASVCSAMPTALAIHSDCSSTEGRVKMAIGQNFSISTGESTERDSRGQANIVYVDRPCPKL